MTARERPAAALSHTHAPKGPGMATRPTFASFWGGSPLSPFERACLGSFAARGYEVHLYSYEPVDLPDGVLPADAGAIAPKADIGRFIYDGRPDFSHFTDYFRYRLFLETDHIWIDTDVLLLRAFDRELPRMLLTKEHETSLCGAVMRLDGSQVDLPEIIRRAGGRAGKSLRWGETGPVLLTSLYKGSSFFDEAFPPEYFYPVLYDVFWKVFLPEERDECAELCRDAYTLHLWNNIVVDLGFWKHLAPPEGSFLHEKLTEAGCLDLFEAVYPAPVMRRMVANWRLRYTGGDVGIGNLVRQIVPGTLRTARRKGWIRPAGIPA